jgi:uncharacterized protein (TIGR02598 family)
MKKPARAFSLVEVVISLGIFTFCAVGIFGLLPIALDSVRSVSQESNANNIAESIAGFWQIAPGNSTSTSGGNFSMGTFTVGTAETYTFYYNNNSFEVPSEDNATLKLDYEASPLANYPGSFTLNLTFTWPPNASENSTTANRRHFNYIFAK